MEKTKQSEQETGPKPSAEAPDKRIIWDCGSSLYDSFELKSFEKQLNSAIASRTLSMPHLSDSRLRPLQPPHNKKKPASRFSRSIQRLFRAVFRHKNNITSKVNNNDEFVSQRYEYGYGSSPVLSTISEVPELEGLSPDLKSLARRTVSDRFSSTIIAKSIGFSCA